MSERFEHFLSDFLASWSQFVENFVGISEPKRKFTFEHLGPSYGHLCLGGSVSGRLLLVTRLFKHYLSITHEHSGRFQNFLARLEAKVRSIDPQKEKFIDFELGEKSIEILSFSKMLETGFLSQIPSITAEILASDKIL